MNSFLVHLFCLLYFIEIFVPICGQKLFGVFLILMFVVMFSEKNALLSLKRIVSFYDTKIRLPPKIAHRYKISNLCLSSLLISQFQSKNARMTGIFRKGQNRCTLMFMEVRLTEIDDAGDVP